MRAALLSIGDELTLGQRPETNGRWLSAALLARSVSTIELRTISDDRAAIAGAIDDLARRADLLVITGGLGPTDDDLTREGLGDVLSPGAALVRDEEAEEHLRHRFERSGRTMPASNLRQADHPPSMRLLSNPWGTAPGLAGAHAGCLVFALPGPPPEMRRMFDRHVAGALPARGGGEVVLWGNVSAFGIGESHAAERLGELLARGREPTVGTTASAGVLTARIVSRGEEVMARRRLEETVERVQAAWAPFAFGRDEETLPGAVGALLRAEGRTLATAESCTGGWLGKMIVDVPGASDYYLGGWTVYANEMKTVCLGVPPDLLEAHGAVSDPVACAMAAGAANAAEADRALAITGLAGPDGAGPGKPAGTVFVGLAQRTGDEVQASARRFRFGGDREHVRRLSALAALQMLRLDLLGVPADHRLLWEVLGRDRPGRGRL